MKNTFVYNNHLGAKKVLSTLESELEMCDEFIFSVAFISESGLTSLLQTLKNLEEKNIRGKILTTNYLYFNTPKVLEKLSNFKNISLKIYDCIENKHGFHTKGYLFRRGDSWKMLMGSSNLTSAALTINKEWNTFIEGDRALTENVLDEFNSLWEKSKSYFEIKDKYVEEFTSNKVETVAKKIISEEIKPNKMQRSFIENFEKLRNQDNKGLLISATGTGKTFAAAFAMKSIGAKKLLFIVHREQIARQALETFKTIFGISRSYGLLTGKEKNIDVRRLLKNAGGQAFLTSLLTSIFSLPTMRRTPVFAINSRSNFSILMLVVGPTETISKPSLPPSSVFLMIGPACRIAPPVISSGSSLPSSTTRLCGTSRQVTMCPVR